MPNVSQTESAIADPPMTGFSFMVVILCCVINIADGLDFGTLVQAVPILSREWGIGPAVIGTLFASTAVGMAVGSFFLAPLSDRFGRRAILIGALSLITVALAASAVCSTPAQLMAMRFLTGMGVGSLMANLNILIIEYSSRRMGNLFLSIMHLCFAMGIAFASQIGFWFVLDYGWHFLFLSAAALNAVILIAVIFLLPESMQFLASVQPPGALERINQTRARMGLAALDALPRVETEKRSKAKIGQLLGAGIGIGSVGIWVAALCYSILGYYHLSWTPKVLDDAGLPTRIALLASTFTSIASIAGNLFMGYFSSRIGEARLTAIFFIGAALAFFGFGIMSRQPYVMLAITPAISFFAQGGFSGLMINAVRYYPPELRGSGVGFTTGFGRFGAIAGPLFGGLALASISLPIIYTALALIALVAALGIFTAGRQKQQWAASSTGKETMAHG
ncbi:MAG: MFS transporter [Sphingobium sp.]